MVCEVIKSDESRRTKPLSHHEYIAEKLPIRDCKCFVAAQCKFVFCRNVIRNFLFTAQLIEVNCQPIDFRVYPHMVHIAFQV
jgi:hypothetical protein